MCRPLEGERPVHPGNPSFLDKANVRLADAVFGGDLLVRESRRLDFSERLFAELPRSAASVNDIGHVLDLAARLQVCRVAARRVVARVANYLLWQQSPVELLVEDAVRPAVALAVRSDQSVTVIMPLSCPRPAFIGPAFVDRCPESVKQGWQARFHRIAGLLPPLIVGVAKASRLNFDRICAAVNQAFTQTVHVTNSIVLAGKCRVCL